MTTGPDVPRDASGFPPAPARSYDPTSARRSPSTARRSAKPGGSGPGNRRIPEATVARLPVYQRILEELLRSGTTTVSSELLASSARVNAAKVRKDLSLLGSFGTRGAGYDAAFLIEQIDRQLGLDRVWPVVIAGIGNLGRALARSQGFAARNFDVAALLDTDPAIIGERVDGVVVRHPDDLPTHRRRAARWPSGSSPRRPRWPSGWPTLMVERRGALDPQFRPPGARGAPRCPAPLRRPQHRAAGDELLPVPHGGQRRRQRMPVIRSVGLTTGPSD